MPPSARGAYTRDAERLAAMRDGRELFLAEILEREHRADDVGELAGAFRRERNAMGVCADRTPVMVGGSGVEGVSLRRVCPLRAPGWLAFGNARHPWWRVRSKSDRHRSRGQAQRTLKGVYAISS